MTFPTTFANLAAGNQPASLIDTMFSITGAMGAIPCTATGTNAITLTPLTNYYLPPSYANYQIVSFVAAASVTGTVTIRIGALAFIKLFMPTGLQANSGDIIINTFYIAAFNAALDSGNGGFIIFNASTPSVIQPVRGSAKNLLIQNGGTPDTQVAVTADEVMLETAGGGAAKVSTVSLTISTGASGANGLDSGSIVANTFYSVWVIFNGSVTAGLLSLSATAPTFPSGYIYSARVGWVRTGAASTNLHRIIQKGNDAQFVVTPASQTTALPVIAAGLGSFWTARSTTPFVPTTASKIKVVLASTIDTTGGGSSDNSSGVAPNNNYATSIANSPYPLIGLKITVVGNIGVITSNETVEMVLESGNIYTGSTGAGINAVLSALGWTDNIVL